MLPFFCLPLQLASDYRYLANSGMVVVLDGGQFFAHLIEQLVEPHGCFRGRWNPHTSSSCLRNTAASSVPPVWLPCLAAIGILWGMAAGPGK
jgi:hypothetical protein